MIHIKRIVTSIILASIACTALFKGGLLFFLFILLTSLLCLNELLVIKQIHTKLKLKIPIFIITIIILSSSLFPTTSSLWHTPLNFTLIFIIIIICSFELFQQKAIEYKSDFNKIFFSVFLICITCPYAIIIRENENGLTNIMFLVIIIITVDSCAYFTGKLIGKTKFKSISKNKTIEGTIGGISCGFFTGLLFCLIHNLSLYLYLPLTIIICVIATIGDLHESLTKRQFNIKNSSEILQGHGGIYDRIDSFMFCLPIFYFAKILIEQLL